MENTIDNRVKFNMQYYGQKVFRNISDDENLTRDLYRVGCQNGHGILELTPLHLISDEDAIELSKYMTYRNNDSKYNRESYFKIYSETLDNEWIQYIKSFCVNTVHFDEFNNSGWDFLRSKGYALPYNGLSVEEQVNYGWVKLKY